MITLRRSQVEVLEVIDREPGGEMTGQSIAGDLMLSPRAALARLERLVGWGYVEANWKLLAGRGDPGYWTYSLTAPGKEALQSASGERA